MPLVARIDELGKPAWIAIAILGFAVWWPLGLATLAFMVGRRKMSCLSHADQWQSHWLAKVDRMQDKVDRMRGRMGGDWGSARSSGNRAFDDYRADTLRRLEDEQKEFREFLERLRQAKDKAEFDQFMADRRNRPAETSPQP